MVDTLADINSKEKVEHIKNLIFKMEVGTFNKLIDEVDNNNILYENRKDIKNCFNGLRYKIMSDNSTPSDQKNYSMNIIRLMEGNFDNFCNNVFQIKNQSKISTIENNFSLNNSDSSEPNFLNKLTDLLSNLYKFFRSLFASGQISPEHLSKNKANSLQNPSTKDPQQVNVSQKESFPTNQPSNFNKKKTDDRAQGK